VKFALALATTTKKIQHVESENLMGDRFKDSPWKFVDVVPTGNRLWMALSDRPLAAERLIRLLADGTRYQGSWALEKCGALTTLVKLTWLARNDTKTKIIDDPTAGCAKPGKVDLRRC
jgi:hypothetical protein